MKITYQIKEKIDIKSFLIKNYYSLEIIHNLFINKNCIKINNNNIKYPFILIPGDILDIYLPNEESKQKEEESKIDIVYEDDYIIVVNKPSNLATIATSTHYQHNLGSQVLHYFKTHNIKSKVHFINRLDKETQGLVLIAKHQYIHNLFAKKVKLLKKYKCIIEGVIPSNYGLIDLPIKKQDNSIKRVIDPINGKKSLTEYFVLNTIDNKNTLLNIILHTGRTHQIRLHLSSIGYPLVGDPLYNENKTGEFFLKSYYLEFIHPITNIKTIIEI